MNGVMCWFFYEKKRQFPCEKEYKPQTIQNLIGLSSSDWSRENYRKKIVM